MTIGPLFPGLPATPGALNLEDLAADEVSDYAPAPRGLSSGEGSDSAHRDTCAGASAEDSRPAYDPMLPPLLGSGEVTAGRCAHVPDAAVTAIEAAYRAADRRERVREGELLPFCEVAASGVEATAAGTGALLDPLLFGALGQPCSSPLPHLGD